jgi:hypothetical protein
MSRAVGWALGFGLLLISPSHVNAESPAPGDPGLARQLMRDCLKPPGPTGVAQLAEAVGAKPYPAARRDREFKASTSNYEESATGRDQRTTTTITDFRGWDLPGPSAGTLEYQEDLSEIVWLDRATGQAVTPVQTALGRTCRTRRRSPTRAQSSRCTRS